VLSRRQLLALTALGSVSVAGYGRRLSSAGSGYGRDPQLTECKVTWRSSVPESIMRTVHAVCDCVLPSTTDMPAGSTVGVPQFMALWISAPYPDQREDREKVMTALTELDATAKQLYGRRFVRLSASEQESVFLAMPLHDPESSSSRLVDLLIIGYATSDDGMKAIGYLGNQVLPAFPGTPLELNVRFEQFKRAARA
jgi:hypothetical protein